MNNERKIVIQFIFILIGVIYIARLTYIQLVEDRYVVEAEKNATRKVIEYPARGVIYDRNGKALVTNKSVFDIMVVFREMKQLDTFKFCNAFGITKEEFKAIVKRIKSEPWYKANERASRNKPVPFIKQLSLQEYAKVLDIMEEFRGFYPQVRTIRTYPYPSLANALGYIGEISGPQLEEKKKANDEYYERGDYIGISGLESSYESVLRGKKGVKYVMKDANGKEKGAYLGGQLDETPQTGEDIKISIDLKMQQLGEELMQHKVGSIVALEPSSGEILAFVSAPSYDPNLLTGRTFSENFAKLQTDPLKPLYSRPLMAMYPPGSIFKLAQSLVGQQTGTLTAQTTYACAQDAVGVKCHPHPHPNDLKGAIQWSCNPYFFYVFKRMMYRNPNLSHVEDTRINYQEWRNHMSSFGFGKRFDIDLPFMKAGNLPTLAEYDRRYGADGWKHSTIRSLDIGQGELQIVPLQMANLAAAIANKGYYYTPHFVKQIGSGSTARQPSKYKLRNYTTIDSSYFNVVHEGMELVVKYGTAYNVQIPGITICGKTGTVQNALGKDHSVFVAFAPRYNPKIAIAVYVENAGFGAEMAAPIASMLIEQYLKDTLSPTAQYQRKSLAERVMLPPEVPYWLKKPEPVKDHTPKGTRIDSLWTYRRFNGLPPRAPYPTARP